jgi:hypothetical protein
MEKSVDNAEQNKRRPRNPRRAIAIYDHGAMILKFYDHGIVMLIFIA